MLNTAANIFYIIYFSILMQNSDRNSPPPTHKIKRLSEQHIQRQFKRFAAKTSHPNRGAATTA